MKLSHCLIVFAISTAAAILTRQFEILEYNEKLSITASMICDAIQVRAQGGSTRDVHDQVFSFLRKRSPDPRANVVVRNGQKEVGSQLSVAGAELINLDCAIEGAPEYSIKMSFHRLGLLSLDLVEFAIGIFYGLLILALGLRASFRFATTAWTHEILSILREDLGIARSKESIPPKSIKFLNRKIGLWMSGRLSSIKQEIHTLKDEIENKKVSLQESEDVVATQSQVLAKGKLFEDKVRMIKHDLKSPLSSMKFAVFNKEGESEVLPGIIATVEKILADLENSEGAEMKDSANDLRSGILEVIAKRAIEQKQLELGKESKIKISFQYEIDALSPVKVRSDYLSRAIANLLQNAIEAIGNGTGEISIRISNEPEYAKLEVTDSGGGIAAEIKDRLFSKGASYGKPLGTGLGLFFVKSTIEAWGGDVSVESIPGKETTVTLRLPMVLGLKGLFVGPQSMRAVGEIVLVDDEAELIAKAWNMAAITCFTTPQQFIEWWESSGKEDFKGPLVIDLHLSPYINGLDVLREIGPRPATFLSSSDYMSSEMLETVRDLGVRIVPKQLI